MATTGPRVVKAALVTLLEADNAFTDVTIYTYTVDTDSIKTREWLVLGDVKGGTEWNAMGGKTLSEYTIECVSSVHQPAPNATADRGWAILDALAEVLASGWTVSGNALDAEIDTFELSETIHADGGRRVDIEFTIKVRDLNG